MFRESVTFDDGGFRKIDVDSHATIDNKFRLTDFTCLIWFKVVNTGFEKVLFDARKSGSSGWQIKMNSSEKLYFKYQSVNINAGENLVNDGDWHQVVVSYDRDGGSGNMALYQDGVRKSTGTKNQDNGNDNTAARIGAASISGTAYYHDGNIGEIVIWDKHLSNDQCQRLYNASGEYTKVSGYRPYAHFLLDEDYIETDILDPWTGQTGTHLNIGDVRFVEAGYPQFGVSGVNN